MAEIREVCKICYNSSSHKTNPILTPFSRTTYDATTRQQTCPVCRQEWAPIRICREPQNPRWMKIRPRPKIPATIDFQMCKNVNSKIECPKGQDCSFAHSQAELASWNRERQNEPRPAPQITGPYQYQLCKHMLNTGTCPYGQRCTFAHSDEELEGWLKLQAGPAPPLSNGNYIHPMSAVAAMHMYAMGAAGMVTEYRCDVCNLNCTSKRQLDDHLSGSKHKQMLAAKELQAYNNPTPSQQQQQQGGQGGQGGIGRGGGGGGGVGGRIRRRPTLSFPINGYKMCMHIQSGRRCVYGDYCTFAHSQEEYDEWNRQLVAANTPRQPNILRFQQAARVGVSEGGNVGVSVGGANVSGSDGGGSYDLDDFEDEAMMQEKQDYAYLIRSKLASEHKQKSSVSGFEKTREGVSITEITGRDLSLVWSTSSAIEWVFEVTVEVPCHLNSIVLFDTLSLDFEIAEVLLVAFGGQTRTLTSYAMPKEGVAWQLNQRLSPPEKLHVKVKLIPRSGLLGQLVVFDFDSFLMVRGLSVHVLTEQELRLSELLEARDRSRPPKPDLYWEQHFTTILIDTPYLEESDQYLPTYQLPEQVEKLLEMGKYENVENRVTKENYRRRMHNLLYLEEYERRKSMSRYDLYDVIIVPHDRYTGSDESINQAPPGFHFIKLSLGEMLFEGNMQIRPTATGKALLLPLNQQVAHQCLLEHVGKDSVILRITSKAKQACVASQNHCSIRFIASSRVDMRAMHAAIDQLNLDTIFPMSDGSVPTMDNPSALKKCLDELKGSELNKTQQDAITSMLDPACRQIPSLVLGPFGCGKTRTLKECIKLLCLHFPETRILICTHTNSAADLYVQGMHEEWAKLKLGKPPLTRILFSLRRFVGPIVREYCKMVGDRWVIPPLAELKRYKMVVATLSTARNLLFTGLPKDHFTHIFIDEAAQALEPESVIPLVMANPMTKIVLAGDHMQLDPPVYSPLARKYNLHLSLLERLYDHEAYDNGVGQLCKTLLTENHRSHQLILSLPSKLFYKNKLTCKAVFPSNGPKEIPAIKFVGVEGHEEQDDNSPSFYNTHEATEVARQVQLLVKNGLSVDEICVLSYYYAQIQRIRRHLRERKFGKVEVQSIENVQGREFRALLISTVRTCSSEPLPEEDAGFLTNAKLFNTAVTRAKQWLIVVGEPITLCTVGSNRLLWGEFIKNCQQVGSFEYNNAEKFESCLEDKIVVRQLLEKVYSEFFGKLKHLKAPSNGKGPSSAQQPQTAQQSTSSNAPPNYYQATPQLRQHILRSKVSEAAQSGDEATIAKITEDLSKLSVQQQAYLLSDPKVFTAKVRETEQVLRRAGPTAAIMNTARMQGPLLGQAAPAVNPGSGAAALMSDLPPFLQTMMGAVMNHLHWCDSILHTNPIVARSKEMTENMMKQKTNLQQQIGLVNEQIQLYRDIVKRMKVYQAQVATAGMAQTQPVGTVGGGGASAMMGGANMMRTMGGSMTNAAMGSGMVGMTSTGGQFMHQSQPVFHGHMQPALLPHPYLHPQMKQMQAQQFHQHPSMHNATEQQVQQQQQQQQAASAHVMMTNQQQGFPPQHPGSAHFQQQQQKQQLRSVQSQQQPAQQVGQVQPSAAPQAPPSNTSYQMAQPGPPAHFPQAFPTAHPLSQQTPQHFPSALPSAANHQALLQHLSSGGGSRMMSQAVGAAVPGVVGGGAAMSSASSGPQGSSAFTYGVSAGLANSQEQQQRMANQQQLNQLSVQTGMAPGQSGVKNLSPLDAAINETSTRSSPAVARRPMDSELYVSDDEF